jgi:hypothetical protein
MLLDRLGLEVLLESLVVKVMYTSLNTELDKGEKAFKRIKEQISAFRTKSRPKGARGEDRDETVRARSEFRIQCVQLVDRIERLVEPDGVQRTFSCC